MNIATPRTNTHTHTHSTNVAYLYRRIMCTSYMYIFQQEISHHRPKKKTTIYSQCLYMGAEQTKHL